MAIERQWANTFRCVLNLYLEFQFHASDILPSLYLGQFLDVGVQVSGGHFCCAAVDGLLECVVYEDVLVFCLHHVVALGAHERYMSVDVHCLLVLDTLQHGINHNEAACATHPGAAIRTIRCVLLTFTEDEP